MDSMHPILVGAGIQRWTSKRQNLGRVRLYGISWTSIRSIKITSQTQYTHQEYKEIIKSPVNVNKSSSATQTPLPVCGLSNVQLFDIFDVFTDMTTMRYNQTSNLLHSDSTDTITSKNRKVIGVSGFPKTGVVLHFSKSLNLNVGV
jgi:hypothetical protein